MQTQLRDYFQNYIFFYDLFEEILIFNLFGLILHLEMYYLKIKKEIFIKNIFDIIYNHLFFCYLKK